jgi:hypothetical protein
LPLQQQQQQEHPQPDAAPEGLADGSQEEQAEQPAKRARTADVGGQCCGRWESSGVPPPLMVAVTACMYAAVVF